MGCEVAVATDTVTVRGPARLRAVDADFTRMGDVATTLMAIAPFADGPVTVRGIAQTHFEESDRPVAAATELRRMGLRVESDWDSVTIHPGLPQPSDVHTYDDHRIAMSFAVTGLRAPGIRIPIRRACRRPFRTSSMCSEPDREALTDRRRGAR